MKLSEHFEEASGRLRDPGRKLWRLLCDGLASPLAAAAAAAAGLPAVSALPEPTLLGLPEELLLEVLLAVARGYREPPPEGGKKEDREGQGQFGRGRYDFYGERHRRCAAAELRRRGVLAGSRSFVYLDRLLPPAPPRRSCRQEVDLISVALSCRALGEAVLGGGGAAAGTSSSLLWDVAAAAMDPGRVPSPPEAASPS